MASTLLLLASITILISVGLGYDLYRKYLYRNSLHQHSPSDAAARGQFLHGFANQYRQSLHDLFHGDINAKNLLYLLHYIALHLSTPLLGCGFLLRTDANVLVAIASLIFSIQLLQRLYPGNADTV